MKHCPGFREAKSGDMHAALKVANSCINTDTITEIKQKFPDAVLLPVISKNKLPEALAATIGMKTHTGVYVCETLSRKSLCAMERLLHSPVFDGRIIKGKRYIIVDDIITQGGTVSALRKFIITNGGFVDAIVTLSYSVGSRILVPTQEDFLKLGDRFSLTEITKTLIHYNVAHDLRELTRSQIRYLLLFKNIDELINRIKKVKMPPANLYEVQECA